MVVEDKPIPKPQLRVCTWNGECPEVLPECAMKFTAGSDAADEWAKSVQEFDKKHGMPSVAVHQMAGPDFTSDGLTHPLDRTIVVDLPPRSSESALVPAARMTSRFDPIEIILEKDTGDLYLTPTDAGQDEFEVGPSELFGFGLGAFEMVTLEEARAKPLPCLLPHDCALVVRLPEGTDTTKHVVPLATMLFECERHLGVSNVSVQGHTVSPNGSYFHRYIVSPEADVYCMTPNSVETPVARDTGDLPATRAGEFGAVLLGSGAAAPSNVVRVVWDMALGRVPLATLTFSKPKSWLTMRKKVQKGK